MPEYAPKKRFLTDEMCKASAYRIAGEIEAHKAGASGPQDIFTAEDFDRKAARLYHPQEFTFIREVLIKMGALSA
jgi:hypothetical protein